MKLDRELFQNTTLTKFNEYTITLRNNNEPARTLLYDGASIHCGKTYKWLEDRNLPHLKSWSKRRKLDVDPSKFYTTYSCDFNPSEFIIYLVKEGGFQRIKDIPYPTREQMVTALRQSWEAIPMTTIKRSIKKGWRKRLKQCIESNGDFGDVSFNYN